MNILITGGAGFIGSLVVERLVERGDSILVIDNFATGRKDTLSALSSSIEMVEDTIASSSQMFSVFEAFRPEIVIHCAASYKDPDDWLEDSRTNVVGTVNVVKAALRSKVRRLIYFQTSLCYGARPVEQPITLNHPLRPQSSYAISKTAAEHYIAMSGLDFVSLRLANMYGPRNLSGPVPTFYKRLSEGKKCFAVKARRDFMFIEDLVPVVLKAVDGVGKGYYHVASGKDYAIRELYDGVTAAMGISTPVEERDLGPDDVPTILLDPSRTNEEFEWKPTVPLKMGIQKAVEWYRKHGVDQTFTHLRLKD